MSNAQKSKPLDGNKLNVFIGQGGFSGVRRAAETSFNMILEARP